MSSMLNSKFNQNQISLINKKRRKYRLFYSLLFKYYEIHTEFFTDIPKFSGSLITNITKLLKLPLTISIPSSAARAQYQLEIKDYFGVDKEKSEALVRQYIFEILPTRRSFDIEIEEVAYYLKKNKAMKIVYLDKFIAKVIKEYENSLFTNIANCLDYPSKAYLDGLLIMEPQNSVMAYIKSCPQGISLKSVLGEAEKLRHLQLIELPEILHSIPTKQLKKYYRSICTKYPSAIRAMPEKSKYVLLSIFCFIRRRELSDNLLDMLLRLVQKIFKSADNKLKRELSAMINIKDSCSNKQVLKLLIDTILSNQDKVIKDVVFEVIPKSQLELIKSNFAGKKISYEDLIYDKARRSYIHHYRAFLKPVLELLDFYPSNEYDKRIIKGIEIVRQHFDSNIAYYPENNSPPIIGAVKRPHKEYILDNSRVNRINYELSLLYHLKDKLKTKEIWIQDSYKYRNPEEDLPSDFADKRAYYYDLIGHPLSAKAFIQKLKKKQHEHLNEFNKNLPKNHLVEILKKPKGHIKVAKLTEQPPPPQLDWLCRICEFSSIFLKYLDCISTICSSCD